jgi:hypothetical protein
MPHSLRSIGNFMQQAHRFPIEEKKLWFLTSRPLRLHGA